MTKKQSWCPPSVSSRFCSPPTASRTIDARDRQRLQHQHPFVRQQRPRLEHQHPGQADRATAAAPRAAARPRRRSRYARSPRSAGPTAPRRGKSSARAVSHDGAGALASSSGMHRPRPAGRRAQQQHAAGGDQQDQQAIAAGPDQVLGAQREHRLQQHRIGQQREEAADVRGRVEEIGIGPVGMAGADEPGLQQRIVGGEREERQPDRDREQAEQPERIARSRRLAPAAGDRQRQRQQRQRPAAPDAPRPERCGS